MNTYDEFLEAKAISDPCTGLTELPKLNPQLFDFQHDITAWALRRGRAAIFADCGLGKTPMQLEWARHVPGNVLILAPLAVSAQTVREGAKFGIEVNAARRQGDVRPGITITNYEMLEHFDASYFTGIVLDESSILKSFDGKTQGIPDYLVTMRKPGENPERVTHTPEDFPVRLWQNYASPVWMDIDPSDTLTYREARENNDERHICPLQLQIIERAIKLWSNPGDVVFSPFAGIGSEGYTALKMGRRFLGAELKRSYWLQAQKNLKQAKVETAGLFA